MRMPILSIVITLVIFTIRTRKTQFCILYFDDDGGGGGGDDHDDNDHDVVVAAAADDHHYCTNTYLFSMTL